MNSVKSTIESKIKNSNDHAFLRSEFSSIGSKSQVDRSLSMLIKEKKLMRVGLGIYAKAIESTISGRAVATSSIMEIAICALRKMGIDAGYGSSYKRLMSGKSTQVPSAAIINVKGSTVSRKIVLGNSEVIYERD